MSYHRLLLLPAASPLPPPRNRRLRLASFCVESVSSAAGVWMWPDDAGIEREVSISAVPKHWNDDCDDYVHGWAVCAGAMARPMADSITYLQSAVIITTPHQHQQQQRKFWEGPCADILLEDIFDGFNTRRVWWNGSVCAEHLPAAARELHGLIFTHFARRVQHFVRARRLARRVSALAAGRRAALAAGRSHQAELLAPLIAAWL